MAEASRSPWSLVAFALLGVLGMGAYMVGAEQVFDGRARSTFWVAGLSLLVVVAAAIGLMRCMGIRADRERLKAVGAIGVGVLLVPLVLWGALIATGEAFGHVHCGPTPSRATWSEPGLYASVADAEADGIESFHEPAGDGLPFYNRSVQDAFPDHRLVQVAYHPSTVDPAHPGTTSFRLEAIGASRGLLKASALEGEEEGMRDGLTAFLDHTTTRTGEDMDRLWSAFLANRTEADHFVATPNGSGWDERAVYQYHVPLEGQWRLSALFNATGAADDVADMHRSEIADAGRAFLVGEPWTFRFTLPSWVVPAGAGETLRVDTRDVVTVQASWGEMTNRAYLERINNTFSGLGPFTGIAEAELVVSIC